MIERQSSETHQIDNMMNVFTSIRPLYILSKFLGVFPMSPQGLVWKGIFTVKWHDFITPSINFIVSILIIAGCMALDDAASSSHFLSITYLDYARGHRYVSIDSNFLLSNKQVQVSTKVPNCIE